MAKKYMIKETVNHWHEIEVDEEVDIESVVEVAFENVKRYDTGYESIEAILQAYKRQYGFEYEVKPNGCGTDCTNMEVMDEID